MAQGPWGGGSGGGNEGGGEPPRGPQRPERPWGAPPPNGGQRPEPPPERPGGPRRPGQPGDLDDLMRKGQDRLRVLMGGRTGGGGGGRGPGGGGMPRMPLNRNTVGIVALAAVALWAFASFYTVTTGEKSVELLFGRPIAVGDEGLNFAPFPFVTREVVNVTGERSVEIGAGRAGDMDSGLMLTRDQNIVDMTYQVVWNISDPERYLFNLADPEGTIRAVSESAMRDIVARTQLAPILNRDRGVIARDLEVAVQQTLDSYEAGINVARVNLGRADPPDEVVDAFRDVQAAQQERDRLEMEADAYANRVLAQARGEAAQLVEQAEAYRAQAVNAASGEASRFSAVYEEYAKAPEVTRRRMYLETMEKVLGDVNKVLIDDGGNGSGVVPYLPLDQLQRGQTGRPAGTSAGSTGTTAAPLPGGVSPGITAPAAAAALTPGLGGGSN
ncbi:FtsH protease activity modulator HflK [Paracoccus sp. S-4012]|uniref:FtsH protease activity modulator HflK n=1 Tax=Paracoccus sp. S-4012 TaxID=2665648 RepID=UPI0012AF219C|nr:FtsH protease activity modulator HflK [Paracoccus sp. S-4012]MRX51163.1 FtsH protease activity modulator HflK [Paracoccus sp. S-4012]